MNQNQKSSAVFGLPKSISPFSELLARLKSTLARQSILKAMVVCAVFGAAQVVLAQNQFQPQSSQPDFGGWKPPNSMQSVYQNPNPSRTNQASQIPIHDSNSFNATVSGASFPETVTPFDTGIRTANLNIPQPDAATEASSFEDKIDDAAATFSKWKDMAGEKTSGWFEGLKQEGGWLAKIQSMFGSSDVSKMLGSLALVLGVYFAFVWLVRKLNPNGNRGLPAEVIEVMGQVPFGPRKNLQLVRLGSKMLLLLNSAEGTQPIGEITEPAEVDYLASLCPRKSQQSRSTALRHAVSQPLPQSPRITSTNSGATAAAAALGNIGSTNLNDVIRILQQATKPGGTVFEA